MTMTSEHIVGAGAPIVDEVDEFDDRTLTRENHHDGDADAGPEANSSRPKRDRLRCALRYWRQIGAGAALIGSAALVAGIYFGPHRSDQTEAAAQTAVAAAASEGAVALLTYAPDTLEPDLTAAQSHLTGEFLTYYSDFAEQIVAPAAKDKAVHATATVVRAATADVDGTHAKVLIFLNQSTTSKDNPEPAQTASSVMVGMTEVAGTWLISSFDPL